MIILRAPAKLTWYLEVTGVRADGYHELRSEMVTLDLEDELAIEETGDYLRVVGNPDLETGEHNLVARALQLVGRRAGVTLTKRIPLGGGLGGGSADAAAILRWAGPVNAASALRLGGDVPFCQVGGRALVEGVGERVTPLAYVRREVTLFLPDFAVATAAVYRAYDELAAAGIDQTGRNHLERAACRVEGKLARALAALRSTYGDVVLAGSGSTMFIEGFVGQSGADVTGPDGLIRLYHATTTPA